MDFVHSCSALKLSYIVLATQEPGRRLKVFKQNNLDIQSIRYSAVSTLKQKGHGAGAVRIRARSRPHGSLVSFSPFSCAGLTTNILIVFTLTAMWGAAERPALPLLQSWDHSDSGGLISGQTFSHYLFHSHPEWTEEVLQLTPTSTSPSPPSQ